MVTQVLQEVNRAAQYKHAELQGKITLPNTAKTEASASSLVCIFSSLHVCLCMTDKNTILFQETQEINNNETDLKKEPIQQEKVETTVSNKLESKESETSVESSESDEDLYKDIEV